MYGQSVSQEQQTADQASERPAETPQTRAAELRGTAAQLAHHMYRQATNRDAPGWPPVWLRVGAVILAVVFGIIVLILAGLLLSTLESSLFQGVGNLTGTPFIQAVSIPVQQYFRQSAAGVAIPPEQLWTAWQLSGSLLFILALCRFLGARIGWAIFGLITTAIVWSETPQPSQGIAAAITATCWALLSVPAYGRLPRRPDLKRRSFGGAGKATGALDEAKARQLDERLVELGYTDRAHYFDEEGHLKALDIAKKLEISEKQVAALKKQYIPTHRATSYSPRTQREAAECFLSQNHLSYAEVGRRFGITGDAVKTSVRKYKEAHPDTEGSEPSAS